MKFQLNFDFVENTQYLCNLRSIMEHLTVCVFCSLANKGFHVTRRKFIFGTWQPSSSQEMSRPKFCVFDMADGGKIASIDDNNIHFSIPPL